MSYYGNSGIVFPKRMLPVVTSKILPGISPRVSMEITSDVNIVIPPGVLMEFPPKFLGVKMENLRTGINKNLLVGF